MRSWGCVVTSKSELNRAGVPDYVILQDFDFNFPNKYERWRIRKLPVRIPKSHFPQLNLICAGVTFDVTAGARQSGLNFWSGGVALCCRHENKWRRIRNGIINVCGQFLLLMSAFTIIKLIHFGFVHFIQDVWKWQEKCLRKQFILQVPVTSKCTSSGPSCLLVVVCWNKFASVTNTDTSNCAVKWQFLQMKLNFTVCV